MTTPSNSSSSESKREFFLVRFWRKLTEPHSSISDIGEQRQARLASSLSLIFTVFSLIGVLAASTQPRTSTGSIALGLSAIIGAISYLITRTPYPQAGSFLFVLGVSFSAYFSIATGGARTFSGTVFSFVPLALIFGSAILSPWAVVALTGLNVAAILLLVFGMGISAAPFEYLTAAGIITVIGLTLALIDNYRTGTERARLQEVTLANLELQTMRASLEQRVMERTAALDRRTSQLEAAAFVSRQTAAIQDPKVLLSNVVDLITARFGYYHAAIFLLDDRGRYAILQAASSDGGKRMLEKGHRLEVGREGIVGYAAYQKRARIALDVGDEAVFFNNPDLPNTRSEVALPLTVRNKVIGVLDIQSYDQGAFTQDDLNTLQAMADQVALAIDNDRLVSESQASLRQLQEMTSESTYRTWKNRLSRKSHGYVYSPSGVSTFTPSGQTPEPAKLDNPFEDRLVIPITLRNSQIGQITLKRRGKNAKWSERERQLADQIADQVALALENARLLEETQLRAAREQAISTMSSRFGQTTDMDTLLKLAVQELHQLPNITEASIFIGNPSTKNK
jgi:GAF domain-containing protein